MQVEIGNILKPRGLKGELKVGITYNRPQIFNQLEMVIIKNHEYQVVRSSLQNGFGYLMLAGIDTIEKAEQFRNAPLCVNDGALNLATDEVLSTQLIGFDVVHFGKVIGKIKAVENYGGGDFFEIAVNGAGYVQIPNEDDFIAETNLSTKTITLTSNALAEELV